MSKGLEALEELKKQPIYDTRHFYNIVLFKTIEKELKALEIINKKNVNVRAFKKVLLMKQNDDVKLRVYNSQNHREEDDLTKEEYELLKEVLL